MAKREPKTKVVSKAVVGLTEKSSNEEVVAYIKHKKEGIDVVENDLVSVKKLSKRLFNYKRTGENRIKIIFRNSIYKACLDEGTKYSETSMKERNYIKYSTTLTMEEFSKFVDKLFSVEIDILCEQRLENR